MVFVYNISYSTYATVHVIYNNIHEHDKERFVASMNINMSCQFIVRIRSCKYIIIQCDIMLQK